MTTEHSSYPSVTKVIDRFGDWLDQLRELSELIEHAADPGELEKVAGELSVAPADLEMLVRQHPHGTNELPYTLTALGFDEPALWRVQAALLRDMERVCLLCAHKRRCHQELAAGTAAATYLEYCQNADTIDMLRFRS